MWLYGVAIGLLFILAIWLVRGNTSHRKKRRR